MGLSPEEMNMKGGHKNGNPSKQTKGWIGGQKKMPPKQSRK